MLLLRHMLVLALQHSLGIPTRVSFQQYLNSGKVFTYVGNAITRVSTEEKG